MCKVVSPSGKNGNDDFLTLLRCDYGQISSVCDVPDCLFYFPLRSLGREPSCCPFPSSYGIVPDEMKAKDFLKINQNDSFAYIVVST